MSSNEDMRSETPKLIYIAGPFNARPCVTVEENIRAAEALACTLVRFFGSLVHPVVPHSTGRILFGVQTEPDAYAGTLALMRRCDAVMFRQGYEDSKGSMAERADAEKRQQPIFDERDLYSIADPIGHWLRTGEIFR